MKHFDLIVIGSGAAGLVSSSFAAGLGLNVALVSDGHPGGECLWSGCVPTKALIHSAGIAHTVKKLGIDDIDSVGAGFDKAMEFMKLARAKVSHHDSVETVEKTGVKIIQGRAKFVNSHAVEVGGAIFSAKKFIIATGGRQVLPAGSGLAEAGALTHETILEIKHRPEHLVIIGAGPVGVEYAQVMVRLGSQVTIVDLNSAPLPKEEPEVSQLVLALLKSEGVRFYQAIDKNIRASATDKRKIVHFLGKNGPETITCSDILVATGKTPNTDALNLSVTGVKTTERGLIKTNKSQRTSASHIWACGDVSEGYQFTHYADHQARIAVMNACLGAPVGRELDVVPWCTFLDPEVARVGLREIDAREKYGSDSIFVLKYDLDDFDRTILDDKRLGFIKVVINRSGTILGASIVGERAGELIHEFALAMKAKQTIQALGGLIHVYPTVSGAIRNVANQYYRTVMNDSWQSKLVKRWAQFNMARSGSGPTMRLSSVPVAVTGEPEVRASR